MPDETEELQDILNEVMRKNFHRLKHEPPVFEGFRAVNCEPKWLAFFLDVSRAQVGHWLTGRRRVPRYMLFVMTHLLHVLLDKVQQAYHKADLTKEEHERVDVCCDNVAIWMGLQVTINMTVPEIERKKALEKARRYWDERVMRQDKVIPEDLKRSPAHVIPRRRSVVPWDFDPSLVFAKRNGYRNWTDGVRGVPQAKVGKR